MGISQNKLLNTKWEVHRKK